MEDFQRLSHEIKDLWHIDLLCAFALMAGNWELLQALINTGQVFEPPSFIQAVRNAADDAKHEDIISIAQDELRDEYPALYQFLLEVNNGSNLPIPQAA